METFRRRLTGSWTEIITPFLLSCLWFSLTPTGLAQTAQTNLAVTVRHAPNLNGSGLVEGSLQQLLGESLTINGGFTMTGDLLVPGTPTLLKNGKPTFAGTIVGSGSASPGGYQVTLNGNCSLHYLRTRTTPVTLPTVSAPPQPTGTRSVTINSSSQSIGSPATLRNLTLNGDVGQFVIPPGTYGNFIAHGGSGFTLGIAGATQPAIYNLQNLTLNGKCKLAIVGPVILTVANGFSANGTLGATNNPSWLQLQVASGGFKLNGGCKVYGNVTAPAGTVIINGNSCLIGSALCDRFILNGGGCVKAGTVAANQAPVANPQTLSGNEDGVLNITLTGNDPEGATLTYTVLSQPAHGTLTGTAPNLTYTPGQDFNGSDSFTFKVNDGQADSVAATVSITVTPVNEPPTAQAQDLSTPEDTPLDITLAGADVENVPLTFQIVTAPTNGTLTGTAPHLIYTPAANYKGADHFTYRANDGQAYSAAATVSIAINPVDDAPVANHQTVTTDEDTPATITLTGGDIEGEFLFFDVLTQPAHGTLSGTAPDLVYTPATNFNGTDSFTFWVSDSLWDSAPATVSLVVNPVNDTPIGEEQIIVTLEDTATNLVLTASDVDGNTLSFTLTTSPADGTLNGTAPALVFSPAAEFHGTTTFTFVAADGQATSAPVSVTLIVTPVNDPPGAEAQAVTLDEDTPTPIALAGTDVDDDSLTFAIATQPTNGVLSGTAPDLVYTPAANYFGTDAFTFEANDGQTNSIATVTIKVNPLNDTPTAPDQTVATDEDTPAAITLTGGDVEGDTLTFAVLTPPTHGTLDGTPPNLTYTPNADFHGSDAFTFQAHDGLANSEPATVSTTVKPVNDAPVAAAQAITTDEDTPGNVTLTGSNVENSSLTFSIVSGPANGTLTGTAPNLIHTPATNFSGSDSFTFKVNDGELDSVPATVLITVNPVNDAPTATATTVNTLEDTSVNVMLTGSDSDGDALTVTVATSPTHGSLSGTPPNLIYTPTPNYYGPDQFNFIADDGLTSSAPTTVSLDVVPVNDAPTAASQSITTDEEVAVAITLAGSDVDGNPLTYSVETLPAHGALSGDAPSLTYTPAAYYFGTDAFIFKVSDGVADSTLATVSITVQRVNRAPVINAGSDQTNSALTFELSGIVTDDGLPAGSNVASLWSKVSGPGTVTFSDASAVTNSVNFSQSGVYVLQLLANDGERQASDDITILANLPPVVDAGSNQVVSVGDEVLLAGNVSDDGLPSTNSLTTLWTVQSGIGVMEFYSPTNGITTARFLETGVYVLKLSASDSLSSNSDSLTIQVNSGNRAPTVTVGPRQLVVLPAVASLQSAISDDGLPVGGSLTAQWTKISGPGEVTFALPAATNTTASFSQAGDYVVRLTANDAAFTGYADLRIAVRTPAMNEPPVVIAGSDKIVGLTNTLILDGFATDDGLPQGGNLQVGWSAVSGPGAVTFENNTATNSRVTFASVGDYVLHLVATDSQLSSSDEIAVSVYPYNQPPVVNAGPDQTIIIPTPSALVPSGATPSAASVELATSLADVPHWDNAIGQPGLDGWVMRNCLAVGDSVFATGHFQHAGGIEAHGSARWNGTEWFPLYDPRPHLNDNYDASITNIAYFVYDCGTFYFCNQILDCVGARGQEAFVGGLGKNLAYSDSFKDPTARWSGTGWESWVYKGVGGTLPRVIVAKSNMVYLGGGFILQPTNATDQILTNLPKVTGVATWDGTNWGTLGSGLTNTQYYYPEVFSLTVSPNENVYAGGTFRMPTPKGMAENIVFWDGTNWLALGEGITGGLVHHDMWGRPYTNSPRVSALALAENGDLYAAGAFTHAGGQRVNGIARWDGTRWWPLNYSSGLGISSEVEALAVHGRDLYVGGNFIEVGDVPAWRIAQYDGQFWRSLGQGTANGSSNGIYGQVLSLAVDNTGLYVGGMFSKAGGQPANNIAKWVFPKPPTQVAYLKGNVTDDGLPSGALLTATWVKASGPGQVRFADANNPVTTASFSEPGNYVLQLSADDSEFTVLDQATIIVRANQPPTVSAGTNQVIGAGEMAILSGTVTDDGLPAYADLAKAWSVVNGPGPVEFENAGELQTTASFSTPGNYVLRLASNDTQFTTHDDITVTVLPPNTAPSVEAVAWRLFGFCNCYLFYGGEGSTSTTTPLPLGGFIGDDLRPAGILVQSWSQVSGPGQVLFDDTTSAYTTAVFPEPGTYVLRLTVSDTELSSASEITIQVYEGGTFNRAPQVWAGHDQRLTLPASAWLAAEFFDDGPATNLTFNWRSVNGPGTVVFADANSPATTASFTQPGTYELAFDVSDDFHTRSGRVLVIVEPEPGVNRAPAVAAGPPRTGIIGLPISLGGVVTDDGLPIGGAVTVAWSLVQGPAAVTFANANAAQTTVTCAAAGDFVFQLIASDTELSATNLVTVHVVDCQPENLPPVANAGPDQFITGGYVSLPGIASDDGMPSALMETAWAQVFGPLPADLPSPYYLDNWAWLPAPGRYVFRLTFHDGALTNADDVVIEWLAAPAATNLPPFVDAGLPQTLLLPTNQITLNGQVADDTIPAGGVLNHYWEVSYASGEVIFDDTNSLTPTVTFPDPPIDYYWWSPAYYELRLVASDGELVSSSTVTILVGDTAIGSDGAPVDLGADQTIAFPATVVLSAQTTGGFEYIEWLQIEGPGHTVFSRLDWSNEIEVHFSAPGTYRIRAIGQGYGSIAADEILITVSAAANLPPTVLAPTRSIVVPTTSLQLEGLVFDDGNPASAGLTSLWEVVTAPVGGNVTFADPSQPTSLATLSSPGDYTLRLSANDSELTASTDVVVTLAAPPCITNQPPDVNAGDDTTITLPESLTLNGTVTDDGFPPIGVSQLWSIVAGPATPEDPGAGVTFWYPDQLNAPASFLYPGTYVFRLTATDSSLSNADDVTVTVLSATNAVPQVFAGYARVVNRGEPVPLAGRVWDDGLPPGGFTIEWSVLGGPGAVNFTDVHATNTTATFGALGQYTLRLTANDSAAPAHSDLTITVTTTANGNQAPQVSAGDTFTTTSFRPINLAGYAADDGLPTNGQLTVIWSQADGPGTVRFENALQTNSPVTFYTAGTYTLRLTASDSQLGASAELTVLVNDPTNEPPLVYAGGNLVVTRPDAAELEGLVFDDDLPLGYPLLFQWSKVSGPGTVTFTTSSNLAPDVTPWQEVDYYDALAFASFSTNGTYVLRLTGTDTQYTNTDDVTITVLPGVNSAPNVYAGPDQSISLPYSAILTTDVTDDGLENGTVQVSWSKVSGPGPVAFSTVNGVYRATFTATGEYVLRLTANDGALSASDEVTVTVYDVAAPIAEIHSPADAGIITAPANIIGTASSAILESYVLEFRLAPPASDLGPLTSATNWSILASNTVPVVSNRLAVFDPTLLLNGIYELRLTATDVAGRATVTEPITVIVDRNLKIGHFTVSFNDLAVPVPGLPLQITRTYDSRAAAAGIQGDFGIGWTLDMRNVRLQKNRPLSRNWEQTITGSPWDLSLAYRLNGGKPRLVTITFPDGRVEKFQFLPNPMDQALLPIDYPQWRFVPLGNTRGTLVPAGYDDPDGHFLAFSGSIPGVAELFDLNFFFDWLNGSGTEEELYRHPTLFRYSTPEGYRYLIDEIAGLQSVTDPNGNTLLVSTNGLTWSNSVAGTNSLSIAFQRDSLSRITNIVDAAGHAMSYAYAANGNLDSFLDRNGHTNRFAYANPDFAHHLTGIVDGRGTNALQNIYDQDGRIAATLDAFGNAIRFGNEPSRFRQTVTNRLGFVTVNEFDELGRLARKTDALGLVTTYAYDAYDNLLTVSNAACACATRYSYDADGNLLTETDELGRTGVFTYSPRGKILAYTDLDGFTTTNSYDARGNLLTTRDPLGNVTTFTYTGLGKVATMTDPRGGVTQFQYDTQGRLTNEIDGRGYATKYTVDANGNLRSMTREQTLDFVAPAAASLFRPDEKVLPCILVLDSKRTNVVFTYTYDNGGHLVTAILPDGTGVTNNHDASDHIVSTTDQLGQTTTTDYNAAGRPLQISFPDGTSERMAYDAEGQLITHFDRANREAHFIHDPVGRLKQVTCADGRIVEARYNERGWLTNETDACRGNMTYAYDEVGNRISATDALGRTATYTYNAKRACTSVTDPLGRVTTMDYDALNRNIAIHYPNGKTRGASYAGRLVTMVTNEDGSTRQFLYDNNGNLTRVTDSLGQASRFEYDSVGNLVLETDADGETVSHEYDTRHRRTRTVLPDGLVHSYTHDALGRMTSTRDSAGQVTTFGYDERNNVIAVTNALGQVTRFSYDAFGQRIAQTDASGQLTQWTYDAVGRVVSTRFPDGSTEGRSYDSCGRISTLVDRAGGSRSFAYDADGQVTVVTDPLQHQTRFSYDAAGNITSQLDAAGQFTRFTYDSLNRRVGMQLPDGTSVSQGYDARGRLAFASDPLGHSRHFDYDANGRLNSVTDPLGRAITYGYDHRGKLATVTDALERTTGYGYDENGRLIQTIRADGSVLGFGYDSRGLLSAATNALGRLTHYAYDELGRLTGETNALGNATVYAYDALGRLTARTDARGVITSFEYDALGRLTRTVYADGATESSAYDPAGNLVANTDARSNTTHYAYDLEGRLLQITDALTNVTTFTYDTLGRRDTMVDALGRTNLYAYDLLGRLLRSTYPDGSSVVNLYDAAGRRVAVVDEGGHTNSFGYDAANRLTSVTNALGHVTVYAYDELGRLIGQTDANVRITTYQHDALGRRLGRTLPGGASETFAYDPAGNLTNHVDFNGRVCTYAYDALDRPVQKTPDPFFMEPPVTWSYDPVGLRTNMTDAAGATHYAYDNRYRLTRKTRAWNDSATASSLIYSYDPAGNVSVVTSSETNGVALAYAYDALNRLATVTDPRTGTATYGYDPLSYLSQTTQPNGLHTAFQRDARNRVTQMETFSALGSPVSAYAYTLDATGRRVGAIEKLAINGLTNDLARAYTYDAAYRLTSETITANAQSFALNYAYDPVGNRLARVSTLNSVASASYAYDADDGLTSDTYDANGNTLAATVTDPFTALPVPAADAYDHANRLVQRVTTLNFQPATLRFQYDGDGQRVAKSAGGVTTHFQVDELNPTGWPQVLEEHTAPTAQPSTPVVTRVYAYGHAPLTQDQWNGATWTATHFGKDAHGNVRYLTDPTGQVSDGMDYDAFGNLIGRAGNTPITRLFTGEEFDPDLGLYQLRARYHNPASGRFWTRDSFEGSPSEPASQHGYAYGQNDSVNRVDPSGHYALAESLAVSGGAVIARQMMVGLWSGLNYYTHGLGGGEALKAVNAVEGLFIQGLSQHVGISLGRQNFFATMQGAPFLLAQNPYTYRPACECFRYEVVGWNPDAPVYGASSRNAVFEFDFANDATFRFATSLADVGYGSLLGGELREWAAEQARQGMQGGEGFGLWANYIHNVQADVANLLAGAISPQSWVEGVEHLHDRAAERMAQELVTGRGGWDARYQGWASLGGDLLGLNGVLEGSYNVDLATGQALGTEERWRRGPMGVAQMAGVLTPAAVAQTARHLNARQLAVVEGRAAEALAKSAPPSAQARLFPKGVTGEAPCLDPRTTAAANGKGGLNVVGDAAESSATGYRLVSSDAPYLKELLETGRVPANPRGTYFSYDNLGDALGTSRAQIPHDGSIMIEFDSAQLGSDIKTPFGNYGEGPHLEPIAIDFPDFGFGGASQRITTSPINAKRILDRRTGAILYERK